MKEFYELAGINNTAQDFIYEGYTVINFAQVKPKIMEILGDRETAVQFHLYNYLSGKGKNEKLDTIHAKLERLVFKEARGNRHSMAIGWENGNSYLRYHSGIIYKWFKQ